MSLFSMFFMVRPSGSYLKKTHPQKDDDIDIEKEGAWKKLKDISKERLKKKEEAPKDSESSEK